jgi:hypothetical protein
MLSVSCAQRPTYPISLPLQKCPGASVAAVHSSSAEPLSCTAQEGMWAAWEDSVLWAGRAGILALGPLCILAISE